MAQRHKEDDKSATSEDDKSATSEHLTLTYIPERRASSQYIIQYQARGDRLTKLRKYTQLKTPTTY